MNFVKYEAIKFKKKNHIRKITLEKLEKVCHKNAYNLKKISEASSLFLTLDILNEALVAASISIVDENGNIIIFIRDDISKERRIFAIAHEIGHIVLKHKEHSGQKAEDEANEFAHTLLEGLELNVSKLIFPITTVFLSVFVALLSKDLYNQKSKLSAITSSNLNSKYTISSTENNLSSFDIVSKNTITINSDITTENSKNELLKSSSIDSSFEPNYSKKDTEMCYYTKYGEVYHLYSDCHYIKNSSSVYSGTISYSNKDRLCSACQRKYENEKD